MSAVEKLPVKVLLPHWVCRITTRKPCLPANSGKQIIIAIVNDAEPVNMTVVAGAALAPPPLPPYEGIKLENVRLIESAADAVVARDALLAADVIGFDTESKPTFRKGEVSSGPHLIQLATDNIVYLFPAMGAAQVAALKTILESPAIVKAGFGLRDDLRRLKIKLHIETANVVDLAITLREDKRKDVGAKTAVAKFFGKQLQKSKRTSTTNWANPKLTDRQILYAADDAHVALLIYRVWQLFLVNNV